LRSKTQVRLRRKGIFERSEGESKQTRTRSSGRARSPRLGNVRRREGIAAGKRSRKKRENDQEGWEAKGDRRIKTNLGLSEI